MGRGGFAKGQKKRERLGGKGKEANAALIATASWLVVTAGEETRGAATSVRRSG